MVTIIVPFYNAEQYLDKCLKSIKEQTYSILEILMVDDGSNDKSAEIAKRYASIDSRFTYFFQENAGPGAARNNGLDHAHGSYTMFVDADDWVDSDYVQKYVECSRTTAAALVVGGLIQNDVAVKKYVETAGNKRVLAGNITQGLGGCVCSTLYKTETIGAHRFSTSYRKREDMLFVLEVCSTLPEDAVIAYIENYGYHYSAVEDSLSRENRPLEVFDGVALEIADCLCKINTSGEYLSGFVKDILFWDCVNLACSKRNFHILKESEFFQRYVKYIEITSVRDRLFFMALKKLRVKRAEIIYRLYVTLKKRK